MQRYCFFHILGKLSALNVIFLRFWAHFQPAEDRVVVTCVDSVVNFGAIRLEEVGAEDMVDAGIDSVAVEGV